MDGFKPEPEERVEHQLAARKGRKPYSKPAFQFERVFETTALACGKVSVRAKHCKRTKS